MKGTQIRIKYIPDNTCTQQIELMYTLLEEVDKSPINGLECAFDVLAQFAIVP